jgi:hypothetical protein
MKPTSFVGIFLNPQGSSFPDHAQIGDETQSVAIDRSDSPTYRSANRLVNVYKEGDAFENPGGC